MNRTITNYAPMSSPLQAREDILRALVISAIFGLMAFLVALIGCGIGVAIDDTSMVYASLALSLVPLGLGGVIATYTVIAPLVQNMAETRADNELTRETMRDDKTVQKDDAAARRFDAQARAAAAMTIAQRPIVTAQEFERARADLVERPAPVAVSAPVEPTRVDVPGYGSVDLRLLYEAAERWPTSRRKLREAAVGFVDADYTPVSALLRECSGYADANDVARRVRLRQFGLLPSPRAEGAETLAEPA